MLSQAAFALMHPVYEPERDIVRGHYWLAAPTISACLTVNIGLE